jgi:SAM-dependent methyltransferase
MNLLEIVRRQSPPQPWTEGETIPWNEPDFSRRMLKEHLSQDHDLASRRFETITHHVDWITTEALGPAPASVLDLGCGPGLYCQQLAARGYTCAGIDFSPASIEYARQQAAQAGLPIHYQLADLRQADFGPANTCDLAMLVFGEFNVFKPADARLILDKACRALKPGGRLVLEPATFEHVKEIGKEPAEWWAAESGLFGDEPHIMLSESFWDEERKAATNRYYRINAAEDSVNVVKGSVTRWAASQQAYTRAEYEALLTETGFGSIRFYSALGGEPCEPDDAPGGPFWGVVALK